MCVWVPMRETYINCNCMQSLHTATVCSFFLISYIFYTDSDSDSDFESKLLRPWVCRWVCASVQGRMATGLWLCTTKRLMSSRDLKTQTLLISVHFFAPNCKKENILRFKNAWFLLEKNTTFAYAENRVDLLDDDKQQRRRHITEMLVQTCRYT